MKTNVYSLHETIRQPCIEKIIKLKRERREYSTHDKQQADTNPILV